MQVARVQKRARCWWTEKPTRLFVTDEAVAVADIAAAAAAVVATVRAVAVAAADADVAVAGAVGIATLVAGCRA